MMWPLAVDAWSLAGLPLPNYSRNDMPMAMRCLGNSADGC